MLSPAQNILSFEGVEHNIDDLRKKFANTLVLGTTEDLYPRAYPCMMVDIGKLMVEFKIFYAKGWGQSDFVPSKQFYILQTLPASGVVYIEDKAVVLVSRKSARQWQRGATDNNMEWATLYAVDGARKRGPPHLEILAHAFMQQYPTKEAFTHFVNAKDFTKPFVLSQKFWLRPNDGYLMSLYYEDIFVGMVDKEMNLIPCTESETLAEEAINEWGLRKF